jgi:hypothetical protein
MSLHTGAGVHDLQADNEDSEDEDEKEDDEEREPPHCFIHSEDFDARCVCAIDVIGGQYVVVSCLTGSPFPYLFPTTTLRLTVGVDEGFEECLDVLFGVREERGGV